jgi:hypothetical protein
MVKLKIGNIIWILINGTFNRKCDRYFSFDIPPEATELEDIQETQEN